MTTAHDAPPTNRIAAIDRAGDSSPPPVPGELRVRFRRASAGWVRLSIECRWEGGGRRRLSLRASACMCPFESLLDWLECIALGARAAAFDWDGENPIGRLSFDDDAMQIAWPDARRGGGHVTLRFAPRRTVAAFYQALRRFARSDAYDPTEYEAMPLGEALARHDGRGLSREELQAHALTLDREALAALLARANHDRPPVWWDRASTDRRRVWLRARFAQHHARHDGTALSGLRSRHLEAFLDWRAPGDPPLTWP